MATIEQLVSRAAKVGTYAADLEAVGTKRGSAGHLHHVGDDTGAIVTEAYRQHGAAAAADVLDAYLDAFNARRQKDGIRQLTPAEAIAHLGWAILPQGITQEEQQQVAAEFSRHHPPVTH